MKRFTNALYSKWEQQEEIDMCCEHMAEPTQQELPYCSLCHQAEVHSRHTSSAGCLPGSLETSTIRLHLVPNAH
jgi:hypothetical protein